MSILLMAKNFGRYETSTGMGDGTRIFECMEPLRQWRITFDGVTYLTTQYWGAGRNDFDDQTFEAVFRADGVDHVIEAETLDEGYYWTCFAPRQLCAGMDPNRTLTEKHWITKEVAVRYTWDGEATCGLLEISRRRGDR